MSKVTSDAVRRMRLAGVGVTRTEAVEETFAERIARVNAERAARRSEREMESEEVIEES